MGSPTLFGMPWKETCAVLERHHLVNLVHSGVSVSEASRLLGVSRKSAHKWLDRYDELGRSGLDDRSRARLTQPNATSGEARDLLIRLRKKLGVGPRQLLWQARRVRPELALPSVSTVSAILLRAGLSLGKVRRRRDPSLRGASGVYRAGRVANEQWTIDFKGDFLLGDRSRCYPLTIQDDATRYVLCVDGHASPCGVGVQESIEAVFRKYGIPQRIHSDNGAPFASNGMCRLSQVSVSWMRQGIEVCRSRPSHPEDNPRHERMHRTLKARTTRPPSMTPRGQQIRFTRFARWMNEERGHEALGMRAPVELWRPSSREWCSKPADPEYPGHWEVRRVRRTGMMQLRGRWVFMSQALGGEPIGLEEIADGIWRAVYRRTVLGFVDVREREGFVISAAELDDADVEDEEESCSGRSLER